MVDIVERMAIRDWAIQASNGDRQEVHKGQSYTTTQRVKDGMVTLFNRFWVPVPLSVFETPAACPHCGGELSESGG
jgi:hypothetical protein